MFPQCFVSVSSGSTRLLLTRAPPRWTLIELWPSNSFSPFHGSKSGPGEWRDSPCGPRPAVPNTVYATLGPEVHEQMFWSGSQPDTKRPVLSFQASLVLIYRPTEGMKG
ncbi:hypothetical protein TNCV_1399861 [Trichonephila clavipes]|nr:hypothetical protein TNCV_1399861 [Trichonephila clavipes]